MASTSVARLFDPGPQVPAMGTLPAAANSLFPRGTIITRNATGFAVSPSSADASGFPAMGVANATFDNRTGSEAGGTAGDLDVELTYGVFGFDISGDTPLSGDTLYVVDNQTLSSDSAGGTRGVAGPCTESREGLTFCWFGPQNAEGVGVSDRFLSPIPLGALRLSSGAAVPAFGAGTADGFALDASEAMGLRINDDSTTTFAITMTLVDHDGLDLVLHVLGARIGAADVTATLTVGAFFHTVGAAYTADANAGGSTTAFEAATTVVSEETLTIAAADVPPGPCSLTLTFTASAALDDDDLLLTGMWLEGARAA